LSHQVPPRPRSPYRQHRNRELSNLLLPDFTNGEYRRQDGCQAKSRTLNSTLNHRAHGDLEGSDRISAFTRLCAFCGCLHVGSRACCEAALECGCAAPAFRPGIPESGSFRSTQSKARGPMRTVHKLRR
jgi:hypothetical protein